MKKAIFTVCHRLIWLVVHDYSSSSYSDSEGDSGVEKNAKKVILFFYLKKNTFLSKRIKSDDEES